MMQQNEDSETSIHSQTVEIEEDLSNGTPDNNLNFSQGAAVPELLTIEKLLEKSGKKGYNKSYIK